MHKRLKEKYFDAFRDRCTKPVEFEYSFFGVVVMPFLQVFVAILVCFVPVLSKNDSFSGHRAHYSYEHGKNTAFFKLKANAANKNSPSTFAVPK